MKTTSWGRGGDTVTHVALGSPGRGGSNDLSISVIDVPGVETVREEVTG